jgi:photosystem II stability/assembly factor-like uncharacterized protein
MRKSLCLAALVFSATLSFSQWTKLDSGTDASLRGVSAVDANICWASGSKGTVLRTTDGGKRWTKLPVPNADKLDFRDVEAFDANTAIIMSAGPAEQGAGRIFKTTDGGAHWKEVLSTDRKGIFFDSMAFWDHSRGIVFSDPVDGNVCRFRHGHRCCWEKRCLVWHRWSQRCARLSLRGWREALDGRRSSHRGREG